MFYPKAILFDLDDTIVDFSTSSSKAWQKVSKEFVNKYPVDFTAEELFKAIDATRDQFWTKLYQGKIKRDHSISEACQMLQGVLKLVDYPDLSKAGEMADSFNKFYFESLAVFKGAIETLEKLQALQMRMALITNGDSKKQRTQLERLNLERFFEVILIDTELGFSKPDPRIFNLALEKLALRPAEVWMVGDSLVNDIDGAQKIGIYSIWNDFKSKGLEKNSTVVPDKIVNSISEILDFLREMPLVQPAN